MEEEEEDLHVCLVCKKSIRGLMNYVNHKKNECSKKNIKSELARESHDDMFSQKTENTCSSDSNETLEGNNQNYYIDQSFAHNTTQSVGYSDAEMFAYPGNTFLSTNIPTESSDVSARQFPIGNDDFMKIVPTNTLARQKDSDLNLSVYTTASMSLSLSSLSPIFTTSGLASGSSKDEEKDELREVTEDHGLLSAVEINSLRPSDFDGGKGKRLNIGTFVDSFPYESEGSMNRKCDDDKEVVDDFFQSLELMSKSERKTGRGNNYNQFPISHILNNLTFSSDEEDMELNFDEDMSFDSLTDSGDDCRPPRSQTGGKWEPGNKPAAAAKNRPHYRGKWPPGEMPKILQGGHSYGPSRSGKNIALIKGMTRKRRPKLPGSATRKREQTKTCTVCDVTFENRFAYSNHCRNPSHKAKALERKEQKNDDDKPVSTHVKLAADGTELTDNRGDEQQPGLVTEEQDADEDISDEIDHESGGDVNDGDEEDDFEEEVANEDTDSYEGNLQENSKYKNKYSEKSISVELPDTKPEHVEKLVPIFVCTICDKKYPNRYYMAKHLLSKFHKNRALADPREHFQMLERYHKYVVRLSPFQCAICRFYFNAYDDFKEHINGDEHGNNCSDLVGEMMCTLCSFKTHQNSEMLKHFVTESHMVKIHENKYACILKQNLVGCKCKFCGLEMRSIKRLTRHVVLKHADKKPVEGVTKRQIGVRNRPICSLCTRKFSCQSALNIHMERKHMNAKKHVCKICNVFFADVYSFKRHTEKNLKHLQKVANSKQVAEGSKGEDLLSNSNCQQTPKLEVKTSQVNVNTAKDVKTPENINESNTAWNINVKVAFPKAIREDAADANVIAVRDTHKDVTGMVETVKTRKRRPKKEPVPSPNQAPMKKLKLVKCDYCDFTVTKYNDLRLHYMENHSAKIKVCEHCDLVFLSEKSYRIHCNSEAHQKCLDSNLENSKEQQFKCDVCKKSFPDEKYRNFHTAYHHLHIHTDADLDKIRGERCATYKQYREFLDHIEATVSDPNTKVLCSECGAHVQRKAILSHLRLHTKDRPFKCNLCAKGFATGNCLRRHLQFHFGIAERKCEFCGKEFFRGEHYMKHMLIHKAEQANEALYSCDICKVNFPLEIQLTRHMRRHEERKYKCEHPGCHWKFVFQGELNAHMRTHMEVKKYLCDFCGFAAHTEYHLRRHKKIHTAERKFHCEYCTYKAGNKTHLRRHMRIHIGSKPFKCPYCSYACNTHENIRKHILLTQKHKGKFVYPCKFCNYGTNSCDDFHKHLTENHENDLGPNFRHTSLSVFTGLYQKDQDPNKPVEGMQIIQLKERKNTRRTKQNGEEDSDDTLKDLDSDQAINLSNKDRKPVKQRSPRRSKAAKLEVSQVNHLDAAQYLILLNADAQHYADMNEVEDLSAKDLIIDDTPLDGDSIKIVPTASSYNGGSVVTMLRSQYMPMADVPRTHVAQAAPQTYQVHTSGASISYQNYNMH